VLEKTHLRRPNIAVSHPSQTVVHKIKICRNYCILHPFIFKGRKFRVVITLLTIKIVVFAIVEKLWISLIFSVTISIINIISIIIIHWLSLDRLYNLRVSAIPFFFFRSAQTNILWLGLKSRIITDTVNILFYLIHCKFLSVSLIYAKIKAIV
jgi:hypothetical protein